MKNFLFILSFLLIVNSIQCSNKIIKKDIIQFELPENCNYIDDIYQGTSKKTGFYLSVKTIKKENYLDNVIGFDKLANDLKNMKIRTIGTVPSVFIKYYSKDNYIIQDQLFFGASPDDNYLGIESSFIKKNILYQVIVIYYYNYKSLKEITTDFDFIDKYINDTNGVLTLNFDSIKQNKNIPVPLENLFKLNDQIWKSLKIN
jgi:hypothetical protein